MAKSNVGTGVFTDTDKAPAPVKTTSNSAKLAASISASFGGVGKTAVNAPIWKTKEFTDKVKAIVQGMPAVGARTQQEDAAGISVAGKQAKPVKGLLQIGWGTADESEFEKALAYDINGASTLLKAKGDTIRELYAQLPKNIETGKIPGFADGLSIGTNQLYLDDKNMELTTQPKTEYTPLYFLSQTNKTLTDQPTDFPAFLTPDYAKQLFSAYNITIREASTLIAGIKADAVPPEEITGERIKALEELVDVPKAGADTSLYGEIGKTYAIYLDYDPRTGEGKNPVNVTIEDKGARVISQRFGEYWMLQHGGSSAKKDPTSAIALGGVSFIFRAVSDFVHTLWDEVISSGFNWKQWQAEGGRRKITDIERDEQRALTTESIARKEELQRSLNSGIKHIQSLLGRKKKFVSGAREKEIYTAAYQNVADMQNEAMLLWHSRPRDDTAESADTRFELQKTCLDRLVESYKLNSLIGMRDVRATWTWIADPEKQLQAYYAEAMVQLQKGEPLTELERLQVYEHLVDPTAEFVGGAIFDFSVGLNLPFDKTIGKVIDADALAKWAKYNPAILQEGTDIGGAIGGTVFKIFKDVVKYDVAAIKGFPTAVKLIAETDEKVVEETLAALLKTNEVYDATIPWSVRQTGKKLYSDTYNIVSNLFGKPTDVIAGAKGGKFIDMLGNLGDEIATLKSAGKSADEIMEIIRTSGKYPTTLTTPFNLNVLVREMSNHVDPSQWRKLSSSLLVKDINDRATYMLSKYGVNVHLYANGKIATTGSTEIDNLITATVDKLASKGVNDTDKINSAISKVVADFANSYANEHTTADFLAKRFAGLISGEFHDKNRAWRGSMLMKDQLTGWLGAKIFGTGPEGKNLYKILADTWSFTYQKMFSWWVNNILTLSPRFGLIYQPAEQLLTASFYGNGKPFGNLMSILRNDPKMISEALDLPLEFRQGFISMVSDVVPIDEIKMIEFWKDNPDAWRNFIRSLPYYYGSNYSDEAVKVLDDLLESKGVSNDIDKFDLMRKAAEAKSNKLGIGRVEVTPSLPTKITDAMKKDLYNKGYSHIQVRTMKVSEAWKILDEDPKYLPQAKSTLMTLFGVPIQNAKIKDFEFPFPLKRALAGRASAIEASKLFVNSNETYVRLWIATQKKITNHALVNNLVLDDALKIWEQELKGAGLSKKALKEGKKIISDAWKFADGDVTDFVKALDESAIAKETVVSRVPIPEELSGVAHGLDEVEFSTMTNKVNRNLNDMLTSKRANKAKVADADIDDFFNSWKKEIKDVLEESLDPAGVIGKQIGIDPNKAKVPHINKFPVGFENSKVVDEAGKPLVVYHGTTKDFNEFDVSKSRDIGIHFGTQEQARIRTLIEPGGNIRPVYLNIQNPLELYDIEWSPMEIIKQAGDKVRFSDETLRLARIEANWDMSVKTKESGQALWKAAEDALKSIVSDIKASGYDGVKYLNRIEGKGYSWIVFDKSQIKSVFENPNISIATDGTIHITKTPEEVKASIDKAVTDGVPLHTRSTVYKEELDNIWFERSKIKIDTHSKFVEGEETMADVWEKRLAAVPVSDVTQRTLLINEKNFEYASGETQGILANLRKQGVEGNADASKLAGKLDEFVHNREQIVNRMIDANTGFLSTKYPGYVNTKYSEGILSATGKEIKEARQNGTIRMYQELGDIIRTVNAELKAGNVEILDLIKHQDIMKALGFEPIIQGKEVTAIIFKEAPYTAPLTFEKGSQQYNDFMELNTSFGLRTPEAWDAPISLTREEILDLKLGKQVATPIIQNVTDPVLERKAYWDVLKKTEFVSGKSHQELLEPIVAPYLKTGQKFDELTADEVLTALKKAVKAGAKNEAVSLEETVAYLQSVVDYHNHVYILGDMNYGMPWHPRMLPDDAKQWVTHQVTTTSKSAGMRNLLDEWNKIAKKQLADGTLFQKPVAELSGDAVKSANHKVAQAMADMYEKVMYGGKVAGYDLEGAIPYMKYAMRVPTETVYDQFIKTVVPFWGFASRGSATWVRIVAEHPRVAIYYNKFKNFSRAQAYKHGAVDSKGRQLQSTKGKFMIPIGNTQVWIDPMSVSPFLRYFFPSGNTQYDADVEDMNSVGQFVTWFKSYGQQFGMRTSPIFDIGMAMLPGTPEDPYTSQTWLQKVGSFGAALAVPPDIIPPFFWNWVDAVGTKYFAMDLADTNRPQAEWFDYIVENEILKSALSRMKAESDVEAKLAIYKEAEQAIREREQNPLYKKTLDAVRLSDYYKQLSGWAVGIYGKPFTPGDVELYALRDEYNRYVSAMNDDAKMTLLFPKKGPTELYNLYTDKRYNSPEGKLWTARNAFSWVVDENGNSITGQARRDEINIKMQTETLSAQYFAAQSDLYDLYDIKERALPVGTPYDDPRRVENRNKLWTALTELENQKIYEPAQKAWTIGYKPQNLVYEHYQNLWWQMLYATYPQWDTENNQKWTEHQIEVRAWFESLPKLAKEMKPIFNLNVIATMSKPLQEQDVLGILPQLMSQTDEKGFLAWQMGKDSPIEAVMRAWESLYSEPYFAAVDGLKGYIRTKTENDWLRAHPKPTTEQLIAEVIRMYGAKFTPEELALAISQQPADQMPTEGVSEVPEQAVGEKRGVLGLEESQVLGQDKQEKVYDKIYELYGWLTPDRKSEFYDTFAILNGNTDDLNTFFNGINGGSLTQEALEELYVDVLRTISNMGINEPTAEQLTVLAAAQNKNEQFLAMMAEEFGEGWQDILNHYQGLTSSLKKKWRKANPEQAEIIDAYYEMRKQFGIQNPDWASVYLAKSSSGASYYGGSYSSGGGGRSGKALVQSGTGAIVPVGFRSSREVRDLLAPNKLGSAGVPKMPKWYTELAGVTTLSPALESELANIIAQGGPISDATRQYLLRLAERYPQYAEQINAFLAQYV